MDRTTSTLPGAARSWLLLSIAMAALAMAGSAITLLDQGLYDELTAAFLPQALAQDLVNLLFVSPATIVLALLALRGSAAAFVLWLGAVLFTVYNYVIYTFAIPFGPMFLPWVAILGMALFALLGGVACVDRSELLVAYGDRRAERAAGLALVVVALLFGALWLSEDIPALLEGTTPQTIVDIGVPTNPVHVLDLAFFLPATLLVAVCWHRGEPRAGTIAPSFLVFLLLTGIPILVTPIVQAIRGDEAAWGVVVPIGTVTVVVAVVLAWLLATLRPNGRAVADGKAVADGS